MKLIVACATNDGRTLTDEHFGSARTMVVARQFGHNISRIKHAFVPIIVKIKTIDEGCRRLAENREANLTRGRPSPAITPAMQPSS
jgi:hypothetical protein